MFSVLLFSSQPANAAGAQVVHAQHRTVAAATPAEVVAIATGPGVRAVTPATASTVVSTTLSPAQSQTRPLVTQVTQGTEGQTFFFLYSFPKQCPVLSNHPIFSPAPSPPAAGMQLPPGKPLTPAHLQILRQQQLQHQQQQQQQAASPQIKAVGKPQVQRHQLSAKVILPNPTGISDAFVLFSTSLKCHHAVYVQFCPAHSWIFF